MYSHTLPGIFKLKVLWRVGEAARVGPGAGAGAAVVGRDAGGDCGARGVAGGAGEASFGGTGAVGAEVVAFSIVERISSTIGQCLHEK